jgi:6-phosphogluconate dehydrogenase
MEKQQYEYGMIGLGTMGRNLVFNMNDQGFSVAGFDKDTAQLTAFTKEAAKRQVKGFSELQDFVTALKTPRVILLLVPAGTIVDAVISELKPFLGENDLLMDCGNSHFTDTARRIEQCTKEQFHFMGIGVSGGEAGARFGPSIMPGGAKKDYQRVAPMLQAIAAKVKDEPCVSWLGPGAAGHYVKMVHNGIEYGLMQLIAEAYHLLKVTGQLNNNELHSVFSKWNEGILRSSLIGITADIFLQKDELTDQSLIDMIRDSAGQKGTGAWTSEEGMALQVPIPIIDVAVSMRALSGYEKDRDKAQALLKGPKTGNKPAIKEFIDALEQALYFAMITTYAQGVALLQAASEKYKYELRCDEVAKIWRGGCIIRAAVLEDIRAAFAAEPTLPNLMLNGKLAQELVASQNGIRHVVQTALQYGVPAPAMMASISYYDAIRSKWLPANLIQAQRDFFGAHTYRRNDREGIFHTHWNTKQD